MAKRTTGPAIQNQTARIQKLHQQIQEETASLTMAQLQALKDFAKENGRTWKASLSLAWMQAAARVNGEVSPELQQVRNTLGPAWLNRVTLIDIEVASVRYVGQAVTNVLDEGEAKVKA